MQGEHSQLEINALASPTQETAKSTALVYVMVVSHSRRSVDDKTVSISVLFCTPCLGVLPMRCLRSMFLVLAAAAAPVAIGGCDDDGSPPPKQSPAQKTRWRGEDTGYQSDEAASAATPAAQPTGRR
jgi:hypothetical protein